MKNGICMHVIAFWYVAYSYKWHTAMEIGLNYINLMEFPWTKYANRFFRCKMSEQWRWQRLQKRQFLLALLVEFVCYRICMHIAQLPSRKALSAIIKTPLCRVPLRCTLIELKRGRMHIDTDTKNVHTMVSFQAFYPIIWPKYWDKILGNPLEWRAKCCAINEWDNRLAHSISVCTVWTAYNNDHHTIFSWWCGVCLSKLLF